MKTTTRPPIRQWFDDESDAVRAVLDLACLDDDGQRDRIVALINPDLIPTIADLAPVMTWIDRFSWDDPSAVMSDFFQQAVYGASVDACERIRLELQGQVLESARLIASLAVTR